MLCKDAKERIAGRCGAVPCSVPASSPGHQVRGCSTRAAAGAQRLAQSLDVTLCLHHGHPFHPALPAFGNRSEKMTVERKSAERRERCEGAVL